MKELVRGDEVISLAGTHVMLARDIPTNYLQCWAPQVKDLVRAVKDMVEAHNGELREVTGEWEEQSGPVPTWEDEPNLYNCQFACTRQDYLAWQVPGKCKPRQGSGDVISTILKKSASGGDQFFVRKAQVIGLGELLPFF